MNEFEKELQSSYDFKIKDLINYRDTFLAETDNGKN